MQMPKPDSNILARRAEIVAGLKGILPDDAVLDAAPALRAYECDALSAYRRLPLAVILPRDTEEVAAALAYLRREAVPVVPRGAGTSLTGGSMPVEDGVILGLSRMNRVLEIDPVNRLARVEAGITNLAVTGAAAPHGFFYAPDPSSQLACAIAGNIAMNSGGAHCLKYGVTTNNLLGLTLVTMQGEILTIGGDGFDAAGLDLLGLICGSEGQLGVVTEATLRLTAAPAGARPILFGFDSSEVAGACVADIIRSGLIPVALEFMDGPAIRACEAHAKAGYPLNAGALLIVEVEGDPDEIEAQLSVIRAIAKRHGPVAMREAANAQEAAAIWLGRKAAFGAMGQIADYICLDGSIPVGALPEALRRIGALSAGYGLEVANIFHAGDGNMHPLILYNANEAGALEKVEALGADILRLCVELGGCLSGEHGVGVEKRDLMDTQFSAEELTAQMQVKEVFDPAWLLNPGKVFPLDAVSAHRAA